MSVSKTHLEFALVIVFMMCVAMLDYLTGDTVSLAMFYTFPIGFLSYRHGFRSGIFALGLASIGCSFVGFHAHHSLMIALCQMLDRIVAFSLVVYLCDHTRRQMFKAQRLARFDQLTGLYNRRAFEELAVTEITRARRSGRPISAVIIDIDNFKRVNDTFGHSMGDQILVTTGKVLKHVRSGDIVARTGGDEFSIILPDTNENEASRLVTRLRSDFRDLVWAQRKMECDFSIGIATFTSDVPSLDVVLHKADERMYANKKSKKKAGYESGFESHKNHDR